MRFVRIFICLAILSFTGRAFAVCNLVTGSGIACVQTANGFVGSSTGTLAFGSNNAAGNTIIVATRGNIGNTSTPTDTRGNTYNIAATANVLLGGGPSTISVYYAFNIAAGANTVNFSGAASNQRVFIAEYSGLTTTDPIDKSHSASGTSTTPASGATTTTAQAKELAFGATGNSDGSVTPTAGAGWTLEPTIDDFFAAEDQILSSTGTPNATWNAIVSAPWGSIVATFKAASAPTGTTQASPFAIAP